MTKTIDQLIDEVIGREGSYSNHPADRGGPTRWGVTQATARNQGWKGDMRDFPREMAVEVYKRLYWLRPQFDKVAQIYPAVAAKMFDTGINMGAGIAVGFLQRALNLLNREASDYVDIAADGVIGPGTLNALERYKRARGAPGEAVLIKALDGFQVERYAKITEGRPANEAFFYGWLANRIGQAA